MEIVKTSIEGLVIIKPKVCKDKRGYFFESYNEKSLKEFLPEVNFVQDNESKSSYGVLRGLHFQKPPFEQSKLVRVIKGKVLDVALDLREKSKTFGSYKSIILSEENKKQFFIPKGFAHGFLVLSNYAIFSYKVDNYYNKESECGIRYDDKELNIDWNICENDIIVSEKDKKLYSLKKYLLENE
tara:strand:+ start:1321 stop:1872 length:552 start_codon:yes stop_codon:yes gene_type:complete